VNKSREDTDPFFFDPEEEKTYLNKKRNRYDREFDELIIEADAMYHRMKEGE